MSRDDIIPLANDDASILSSEFVPHTDSFDEIFGARINRVSSFGTFFSVLDSPTHGLYDKRRG
jgi:hypothetical protein